MKKPLTDLLDYCQSNYRICPKPPEWNRLWEILPNRKRVGAEWQPPAPLILAAWWDTSDDEKQQRFLKHIHWANEHGAIEKIDRYVRSLSENQWHRLGD